MAVSVFTLMLSAPACAAFYTPMGAPSTAVTDTVASSAVASGRRGGSSSSRRELILGAVGGLATAALPTAPAHASYALYQSSFDSFQDRKATGFVPVATNDRETIADIQSAIRRKRPLPSNRPVKAPQYCAGQTAAVTPMMENICANIGVSKADQSNSMTDAYGNMNVGAYTSMSGAERAAQDAKQVRVQQASEAARLRRQVQRN